MLASRMPTFDPNALKPMARFTAVVDLPTPPLPEATAMIAFTPGTSGPWGAALGAAAPGAVRGGRGRGGGGRGAPPPPPPRRRRPPLGGQHRRAGGDTRQLAHRELALP